MLPILNIGPLALPVSPLALLAGAWLCIYLAERFAPHFGLNPSKISSLIILMLVSGIVSARIIYIARNYQIFIQHPADIFSRNPGLLDPYGGIALALIIGLIYSYNKRLPLWRTLDTLAPGLVVLAICIGFANFASGNAFGKPTDLPWGVYIWGEYRHPNQMYLILLFILLFVFIIVRRHTWESGQPGILFLTCAAVGSAIYLFVEAYRADSLLFRNTFRTVQLIAWLVLTLSLWGRWKLSTDRNSITSALTKKP